MIPTFTVDTWYRFPPGRRNKEASWVATYVLGVRCAVYVKRLRVGGIDMTLDRRVLLLMYLLLLKVIKSQN